MGHGPPTLIGAIVACLVILGIAFHGLPAQSAYAEILQLLVLWVILSDHRTVIGSPRFNLIALVIVGSMILINFSAESTFELFENNRSWTSPIFSNPSLFGMVFVALAIFSFMLSRAIPAPRLKVLAYTLFSVVLLFVAASGSRTSMVALAVFFTVYALGTRLGGNRALLWGGALLSLVLVPAITITLPAAVGSRINLMPEPELPIATQHRTSTCIPTPYSVCPPRSRCPMSTIEEGDHWLSTSP